MPHPLDNHAQKPQITLLGGVIVSSCVSSSFSLPRSSRSLVSHPPRPTRPHDSVRVEIKNCGASTCGVVVYASPKAQADARKSGYDTLIGQQLLREFEPVGNGAMRGKVFVPTLKVTLSGTAEFLDSKTMRAKGCVLGKVLCKSQIWTRVDNNTTFAAS